MVVDGTVLGTTILSLIMNGMCCIWQQQEEQENREAIRRDIRAEYWEQKLIDLEIEQHVRAVKETESCSSPVRYNRDPIQEDRRRKLLRDKWRASNDLHSMDLALAASEESVEVPLVAVTPESTNSSNKSFGREISSHTGTTSPASSLFDSDSDDEEENDGTFINVPLR